MWLGLSISAKYLNVGKSDRNNILRCSGSIALCHGLEGN